MKGEMKDLVWQWFLRPENLHLKDKYDSKSALFTETLERARQDLDLSETQLKRNYFKMIWRHYSKGDYENRKLKSKQPNE